MASTVKIKLDLSKYKAPTQEDMQAAKAFVLQREETAIELGELTDEQLSEAAERIVEICYKYDVDPKLLIFSSAFNEDMMDEISEVMDELSDEIYDMVLDYSTKVTNDRSILNPLLAWMVMLGKGNRNLHDTLDTYLQKTMKDWEAAIAAMKYMGVKQADAITKIKTYLHSIYTMPEVLTAFRRRQDFAATYIRLGGVQPGAVGISNNGSTNVVNMGKITVQMAWMRAQLMQWKNEGVAGYYQLRGSYFPCDPCDEEVGFHPGIDEINTKPYPHPRCVCYRIPVRWNEETKKENNKTNTLSDEDKIRRAEIKRLASDLRDEIFTNEGVEWAATISGSGIKEWLNQPHKHITEKNEALLDLKDLFAKSTYLKPIKDVKNRKDVVQSHIFKTQIAGEDSWIIVHEMSWGEYKIHSIADNNPIK